MYAPIHSPNRRGITLLEVIISLGILSVGLASVVALIPAGGDQAIKAVVEDRRGTLGANGLADFVNRGLLDPREWNPAQPAALNYRLLFDPIGAGSFAPGLTAVSLAGINAGVMADEVFRSQDDVSYKLPDDEDAPALPLFFTASAGPLKRLSEGNFSWLATLVPVSPASTYHRLTVVTCHRRSVPPAVGATAFSVTPPVPVSPASQYVTLVPAAGATLTVEDAKALFPAGSVALLTDGGTRFEWRKVLTASPTIVGSTVSQIELTVDRANSFAWFSLYAVEGAVGMAEKVVSLEGMSPWSQ